ncbi:MAG: hypothetical protein COB85_01640 [Bacteroidetes bacterium]|nr:MAG: hypothetical protein COB85_01640 [Bacteroidota bacterium]
MCERANAQACPACSNPALQSSEKLEAGIDTLHKGTFRTTLNVTNGYGYQGGHPERTQFSASGQLVEGGLHEHSVELDFFRIELSLEHTFKTNWSLWLRIPYDIKIQRVGVSFTDNFTEQEKEDIVRNRDIHHRGETYNGISDLRLFAAHRFNKFLGDKARLDVAIGTSLPLGKTEKNPLLAGQRAEKHLHIQFGTGTFDPLIELHYVTGLSKRVSLALFTINKVPFYVNNHDYQGPLETTSGIGLGVSLSKWLSLRASFANFSQSQAKWNGVKDPNSGLISFNGTIMVSFKLLKGLSITPGYRFPIYQQTVSDEGDTFTYGPTFVLNASYAFTKN